MPRINLDRTRRIILKVLSGRLLKQIMYEERVSERQVKWVKKKYIRRLVVLQLNSKGHRIMNEAEGQATFPLVRRSILRVDHRKR